MVNIFVIIGFNILIIILCNQLTVNAAAVTIRHQRVTSVADTFIGVFHVDAELTADSGVSALVYVFTE